MVTKKGFKIIVFDLDGTLVRSNELKFDAYFALFPDNEFYRNTIRDVLNKYFEKSRYFILGKILERLNDKRGIRRKVNELAHKYNKIVTFGAKTCPETNDAEKALQTFFHSYKLYLSSITPEDSLQEIVVYRNWDQYFQGVFGYPCLKEESLLEILEKEKVLPQEILVVGDGYSDLLSAQKIGCRFAKTDPEQSLYEQIRLEIIK